MKIEERYLQDIEDKEMTYEDRGNKRIVLVKTKEEGQKKRDSVKPAVASASIAHKHSN